MPEEEKVYTSMYSKNAELYHHGILGMKWGVTNGPPYPLGSDVSTGKRLKKNFSGNKEEKALKKENKKMLKESKRDTVTSRAVKKAKGMTDEELKAAVNRLDFEKKYANLEKEIAELSKRKPTLGQKVKKAVTKALKEQASKLGKTVVNSVTQEVNKKISETIKDKLDSQLELGDYKPEKEDDKKKNKKKSNDNVYSMMPMD